MAGKAVKQKAVQAERAAAAAGGGGAAAAAKWVWKANDANQAQHPTKHSMNHNKYKIYKDSDGSNTD